MTEDFDGLLDQMRQDRTDRERERREKQGPGLHKVGPNPWDYEFNPAVGQKVAFVDKDGQIIEGTITDFNEDHEKSGVLEMTVEQFPDAPQFGLGPVGLDG